MRIVLFIGFLLVFGFSYTQTGILTDTRDGKVYKTVVIGTQTWMAENLNVSTFRNGDTIPEMSTKGEWKNTSKNKLSARCFYFNDTIYGQTYGQLYNGYAMNDQRGLAPQGWHIPTELDWEILADNLGGKSVAGKKMKSTQGWYKQGNGINSVDFLGTAGGFRRFNGDFRYKDKFGYWWCSSVSNNGDTILIILDYAYDHLVKTDGAWGNACSVRCVKD